MTTTRKKIRVRISWDAEGADPKHAGWKIYGFKDQPYLAVKHRGMLLATVDKDATSAFVEVDEGTWTFRVLSYTSDGVVQQWQKQSKIRRHRCHGIGGKTRNIDTPCCHTRGYRTRHVNRFTAITGAGPR